MVPDRSQLITPEVMVASLIWLCSNDSDGIRSALHCHSLGRFVAAGRGRFGLTMDFTNYRAGASSLADDY